MSNKDEGSPSLVGLVVCELLVYQVKGHKTGSCSQGGHCSSVQHCTIPIAPKCTQHYSSGELSNLEEYCWSSKYFVYGLNRRLHYHSYSLPPDVLSLVNNCELGLAWLLLVDRVYNSMVTGRDTCDNA